MGGEGCEDRCRGCVHREPKYPQRDTKGLPRRDEWKLRRLGRERT
jgi:hypothetical protein